MVVYGRLNAKHMAVESVAAVLSPPWHILTHNEMTNFFLRHYVAGSHHYVFENSKPLLVIKDSSAS